MNADSVADFLVALYNGLDDKPVQFVAEKRASVVASADEIQIAVGVFVIPYSEDETPIDAHDDTMRLEATCSVVINGQLTRSQGLGLVKFLRLAHRETETADGGRYDGLTVEVLYDVEAEKSRRRFVSVFRPTYYTFD
jgi:hypothetical protein